jgi:hypothetical protein
MTTLAIIGFITILLFAVMTAVITVQMVFASMWNSDYSGLVLFFGALTIGALLLAWHLSPFTIIMKTI